MVVRADLGGDTTRLEGSYELLPSIEVTIPAGTRSSRFVPVDVGLDGTATIQVSEIYSGSLAEDASYQGIEVVAGYSLPINPHVVCSRTPQVRDAIVARVATATDCSEVTDGHLNGITGELSLAHVDDSESEKMEVLRSQDFDNLTGLTTLNLSKSELVRLPDGLLAGLINLKSIDAGGNRNLDALFIFLVSLDQREHNQVGVKIPLGLPYTITVRLRAIGDNLSLGPLYTVTAETITFDVGPGSTSSDWIQVSGPNGSDEDNTEDDGSEEVLVRIESLSASLLSLSVRPVFSASDVKSFDVQSQ